METNLDLGRAALIVILTLVGVVFINVAIYYMVKGKGTIGQIQMIRKAAGRVRNPWEGEDQDLQDLSELVKQFKHPPSDHLPPDESPSSHSERPRG
jgi:hypothetical protein